MKVLIIANGQLPSRQLVRSLASSANLIVCADGGANLARQYGIRPDIILGDLDSISPSTKLIYKRIPLLHIADQESTDLEKAIRYCIERKCTPIDIIGALGNRIDHTTGALGILKKFSGKALITLIDSVGKLTLVKRRIRLQTKIGQRLSLIPVEKTTGITTKNLKYPLANDTLELGVREGISNEALATSVTITVRRGTLLVYQFHDR
ncbi:MAG: thiamine diphosphokinase [Ignavibacteriae bacterium]|nr:thiamine diphosphokinase [Ignavibacteriota bacterium]